MLNIDESVVLFDNRLKILQRQSILQILNARFINMFLSSDMRTTFLFQNVSLAFFNNARFTSSARPAFCLSQNAVPTFLILNARLTF